MNTIVCVKIIEGDLNPFDAAALEWALRRLEANPEEEQTTVLCMGPRSCEPILRKTSRLGAFRTILISDPLYAGSDTLATSRILAAAIRRIEQNQGAPVDLVVCGRQSIDGDTAQVGPMIAQRLGVDLAANVLDPGIIPHSRAVAFTALTRLGGQTVALPAVFTMERIFNLRFPSIRSKVRTVEIWTNEQLGLSPNECGQAGSPTRVLKTYESDRGRRRCKFIHRSELELLLERLIAEPKNAVPENGDDSLLPQDDSPIINRASSVSSASTVSSDLIAAVGLEVLPIARTLSTQVVPIDPVSTTGSLSDLTRQSRELAPSVVLWNADLEGRKTAPQIAAALETGLCADCTHLEWEAGQTGRLFMYRPARGGNITAQIVCRTRPQMATVRTIGDSSEIIVSAGRNMGAQLARIQAFAQRFHAQMGASRGLVDTGIVPYDWQVGLTGRSVSPKIYIAIGISGAVQHTCAVENAGVIVAINKDRNARIFEYADFGVVEEF